MALRSGIFLRGAIMKTGLVLLVFMVAISQAQPSVDTTYQVEVTTTASPMVSFFRNPRLPQTENTASYGYGVSVRALWHPGRLLSVGLLTGYFLIAQDEIPTQANDLKYDARLIAIPLQLAMTMQKNDFEFGMGIGPYLMISTIEGGNSPRAEGRRFELGMTFFGSYLFSVGENIKLGPELRVLHFRYRGILSVMPSCSIRISPLTY